MADNKILVFGENAAAEDYLTDAEYSTNEIRNTGNVVGLARRKPNNKALKQATLMASALAQALADSDGEWTGTEINDSLTPAGIKGIFKNYLETKIDSFILSDLNLKADKDLTNLNSTGKANIVNHFANSGTAERIEVIHNGIFRGENLLDYFDSKDDIYTAVASGDFTNIYIGDYIEDTFTYGGTQYTTKFRVAGINSYYNYGDTALTQYHLVMVPDNTITEQMNTFNTTSGGYVGSRMYTTVLPALLAALAGTSGTPFYGHVISHRELFVNTVSNGVSTNWAWYDNSICLMSEQEIYGHAAWGSSGYDRGYANAQLPLFKLAPKYIATFNRTWHWLRSVGSATYFCLAGSFGDAIGSYVSGAGGVRPRFLIG